VGILAIGIYQVLTPKEQRENRSKNLIETVYKGKDGSINSRLRVHLDALEMAKETSGMGVGLGASYKYWTETRKVQEPNVERVFTQKSYGKELIMSTWGQILAEGGLVGILLFAGAGLSLLTALWREWRRESSPLVLASLVSVLIFFGLFAFSLGNVARGDIWVWYAIWSRLAVPGGDREAEASA
jgi:O-antigen ligase